MKRTTLDLIALSMVPGLGPVKIKSLLERTKDTDRIFSLSGLRGMRDSEALKREVDFIEKNGIKPVTILDDEYPQGLKEIYDPPAVLFVKGRVECLNNAGIGIVGSRKCSFYGRRMAEKLSSELGERGINVISGLARGIDASAHTGALKASGITIAVMGNGYRHIYPASSMGIYRDIQGKGAVVTEYISTVRPDRSTFPRRNRIISGLSRGVLVVEAARRSGALITARCALEQGREVFAVPGQIDSLSSAGTNSLIQEGARLVTRADDIIEEIGPYVPVKYRSAPEVPAGGLDEYQTRVMDILAGNKVHIDELKEMTGIDHGALSKLMLELELKGKIRAMAGGEYSLR